MIKRHEDGTINIPTNEWIKVIMGKNSELTEFKYQFVKFETKPLSEAGLPEMKDTDLPIVEDFVGVGETIIDELLTKVSTSGEELVTIEAIIDPEVQVISRGELVTNIKEHDADYFIMGSGGLKEYGQYQGMYTDGTKISSNYTDFH